MSLSFDHVPHRYFLDGNPVPSVTGILKASGLIDFSSIPAGILESARERGTYVHQAIHFYNEQDLDLAQFGEDFPSYVGYLEGWITFCQQRHFVPVLNEHRVASRRYQIAGTLDCLGVLDGTAVLLDFATGRPQDVSKDLQTAAYYALALEWASEDPLLAAFFTAHPLVKRYAVGLRKEGTFHLEAYDDPSHFRQFVTLVEAQRIVTARKGEWAQLAEVA
jgi:hypothetical protein